MKRILLATLLTLSLAIASAQIPATCLNQSPTSSSSDEMSVQRTAFRSSTFFSPMGSVTGYTIGDQTYLGGSMSLQFSVRQSKETSLDFFGGILLRQRNVNDPINLDDYTPLGFGHYATPGRSSSLSGIRLGLGFLGMDYTVYLSDGSVRPYVGFGGMLLGFPSQGTFAATVAPDIKAGLLVNMTSGISGFAEVKHVFGLPFAIGSPYTPFKNLTGFAFGFAFVPRFN